MSKQKKAANKSKPWLPEEDAKILIGTSPTKLVKQLGRTLSSINSRKHFLKNNPPTSVYTPPELQPEVKMAAKVVPQAGSLAEAASETQRMLEESLAEDNIMDNFMAIFINNRTIFVERDGLEAISVEDGAVQLLFKD